MSRYDWSAIRSARKRDVPWSEIAEQYGVAESTVRGAYSRWMNRVSDYDDPDDNFEEYVTDDAPEGRVTDAALLRREDIARITSLEDLLDFFEVDTERWQVNHFRVNKWEQHSVKKGITPLYQVRATLGRNLERTAELARKIYEEARDAMHEAGKEIQFSDLACRPFEDVKGEPSLLEVAAFDPHLGMYAWAQEVGADYDSAIATQDYRRAVEHALSTHQHYNVERILYVVGNDLAHVDGYGPDGRGGMARGGATTAGTVQDFDSRLPKMFSMIRRAVVEGIERARAIAPVDVLIVPGNHDEQTMYKLGEVLAAWFRNDDFVDVLYDPMGDDPQRWPRRRQFYQYGQNLFMFTHGVELKRKRDPLPLVMATEADPEMWAGTTHREIHTGHNHIRMTGGYQPERDVTETRAIITRSLPGLTPEDAWHYNSGYKHARGSTALIYRRSGGLAGLHEFTP